jgi:hypothetical protein
LNIPVLFPIVITERETLSLFTKDTPVPGRTISVWGVKPALVMWMVVTPDAGVAVGVTFTGATVVTTAVVTFTAGAVTFATLVVVVVTGAMVATVVGTGVDTVVTSVTGAVVVFCAEVDAGCVHPVTATSATRRIINPMSSFIRCTHKSSTIKKLTLFSWLNPDANPKQNLN